jgi:hypothetical protein
VSTKQAFPEVWVSLSIMGAPFDPDAVTARLGVEPTSHHRTGDPILGDQGRRRRDRWRVTIGPRDTIEIGGMLSELLVHMAPGEDKLRQVCAELGVEATLTCAVEPKSSLTPYIFFPRDVVRWAASHDVALDIDVMLWGEEDSYKDEGDG